MQVFDRTFIEAQIVSLKTQLTEVTAALSAVMQGQSYSLDTGQTRQTVTRASLGQLSTRRDSILNELRFRENQLCGGATVRVIPNN